MKPGGLSTRITSRILLRATGASARDRLHMEILPHVLI